MERRVLGMPRGLSAGITTNRNAAVEVPHVRTIVHGVFGECGEEWRVEEKSTHPVTASGTQRTHLRGRPLGRQEGGVKPPLQGKERARGEYASGGRE